MMVLNRKRSVNLTSILLSVDVIAQDREIGPISVDRLEIDEVVRGVFSGLHVRVSETDLAIEPGNNSASFIPDPLSLDVLERLAVYQTRDISEYRIEETFFKIIGSSATPSCAALFNWVLETESPAGSPEILAERRPRRFCVLDERLKGVIMHKFPGFVILDSDSIAGEFKGEGLPDEEAVERIVSAIMTVESAAFLQGWVLFGFPRTARQAELLESRIENAANYPKSVPDSIPKVFSLFYPPLKSGPELTRLGAIDAFLVRSDCMRSGLCSSGPELFKTRKSVEDLRRWSEKYAWDSDWLTGKGDRQVTERDAESGAAEMGQMNDKGVEGHVGPVDDLPLQQDEVEMRNSVVSQISADCLGSTKVTVKREHPTHLPRILLYSEHSEAIQRIYEIMEFADRLPEFPVTVDSSARVPAFLPPVCGILEIGLLSLPAMSLLEALTDYRDSIHQFLKEDQSENFEISRRIKLIEEDFLALASNKGDDEEKDKIISRFFSDFRMFAAEYPDLVSSDSAKAEWTLRLKSACEELLTVGDKKSTSLSAFIGSVKSANLTEVVSLGVARTATNMWRAELTRFFKERQVLEDSLKVRAGLPIETEDRAAPEIVFPQFSTGIFFDAALTTIQTAIDGGVSSTKSKAAKPKVQEEDGSLAKLVAELRDGFNARVIAIQQLTMNEMARRNFQVEKLVHNLEAWAAARFEAEGNGIILNFATQARAEIEQNGSSATNLDWKVCGIKLVSCDRR